jgi:hypothetical protein
LNFKKTDLGLHRLARGEFNPAEPIEYNQGGFLSTGLIKADLISGLGLLGWWSLILRGLAASLLIPCGPKGNKIVAAGPYKKPALGHGPSPLTLKLLLRTALDKTRQNSGQRRPGGLAGLHGPASWLAGGNGLFLLVFLKEK